MTYNNESLQSFVTLLSAVQTSLSVDVLPTAQYLQELFKSKDGLAICSSLPSLKLSPVHTGGHHSACSKRTFAENKRRLQESCAEMMATPCHFTHDTLSDAPGALLKNVSGTFKYLVKSRLASSIKAFVEKSSASLMQKKIFADSLTQPSTCNAPVEWETVVTTFRPILNKFPLRDDEKDVNWSNSHVLKMMFSVTMDVCIMGETTYVVRLEVPGECSNFVENNSEAEAQLLNKVHLKVDTELLLQQMIVQARIVAKKAVEIAADSAKSYIASLCTSSASLVSLSSEDSELCKLSHRRKYSKRKWKTLCR